MATTGLLVHQVLLDVRHPAWVPVSPGGETPRVFGAGVTPVAGDWQPLAMGSRPRDVGTSSDYVRFGPDNGLMVTLSPYATSDTIEDHTGDGDTVVQMVSHQLEVPQSRTADFDWTDNGKWLERFVWTVFDDPQKRPLELRERYVSVASGDGGDQSESAGYAIGVEVPILIDGPGADDIITGRPADARRHADGVPGHVADDDLRDPRQAAGRCSSRTTMLFRVARSTRASSSSYYVQQPGDKRVAKGVMGMTIPLQPTGDFIRTGMTS